MGLRKKLLLKGIYDPIVSAYYKYMVDVAVLFGANRQRALEDLEKALYFELNLARISMPLKLRKDKQKLYNPMSVADLQDNFPTIPWQDYFNNLLSPLTIRQDETIIVTYPKYLSGLEVLLMKTPKRYKK